MRIGGKRSGRSAILVLPVVAALSWSDGSTRENSQVQQKAAGERRELALANRHRKLVAELSGDPRERLITHTDCVNRPTTDRTIVDFVEGIDVANIPEFHDCQGFVEEGEYIGLFSIWSRKNLGQVVKNKPEPINLQGLPEIFRVDRYRAIRPTVRMIPNSRMVARVRTVESPIRPIQPIDTIRSSRLADRSVAANMRLPNGTVYGLAVIVAHDTEYPRLGIKLGINCLYVGFVAGEWQAVMTSLKGDKTKCPREFNFSAMFTQPDVEVSELLAVRAIVPTGGLKPNDIPEVSRWISNGKDYYIGMRCGDEWCEIGSAEGWVPETMLTVPTNIVDINVGTNRRVFLMRGWYDRQQLALDAGTTVIPGGPDAIIVPHFALKTIPRSDFEAGWKTAAFIYVNAPYPKLGLAQAWNFGQRPNILQISRPIRGGNRVWMLRVLAPDGTSKEFRAKQTDHSGFPFEHTARWRWDWDDEKTWVGCLAGCCTEDV